MQTKNQHSRHSAHRTHADGVSSVVALAQRSRPYSDRDASPREHSAHDQAPATDPIATHLPSSLPSAHRRTTHTNDNHPRAPISALLRVVIAPHHCSSPSHMPIVCASSRVAGRASHLIAAGRASASGSTVCCHALRRVRVRLRACVHGSSRLIGANLLAVLVGRAARGARRNLALRGTNLARLLAERHRLLRGRRLRLGGSHRRLAAL